MLVAPEELPPPKPATWTVREPEGVWCPAEFHEALRVAVGDHAAAALLTRTPQATMAHTSVAHTRDAEWHVTGASRRGRRHAHVGAFNEDALFVHHASARGVLVVADGAGSSTWSRLGSAITAHVVGASLRDAADLTADTAQHAISSALDAVRAFAAACAIEPRALRTTVIAAAWTPLPNGTRVLSTQVGDGALVLAHADGRISRPSAGDSSDWSGEVGCFVPDSETAERATAATVVLDVPDLAAILLATDGVDDPFYPFPKHAPAILGQLVHGANAPLMGLATQAESPALLGVSAPAEVLLDWLAFEKRGENDDRTLAVALHRSAPTSIAPWAPSASA